MISTSDLEAGNKVNMRGPARGCFFLHVDSPCGFQYIERSQSLLHKQLSRTEIDVDPNREPYGWAAVILTAMFNKGSNTGSTYI